MSSMYYKREVQPPPPVTYGFRKIASRQEENEITNRLIKSTYERKIYSEESKQVSNYQYLIETGNRRRPPSSCTRTPTPSNIKKVDKRLSDRDMIRLLRRLMKPTESIYNSKLMQQKQEEQELKEGRIIRSKTPSEAEEKVIQRVQRPTTASRAKKINDCHLCYEHEIKSENAPPDVFDYYYGDESKRLKPDEMEDILRRMRTPTYSSVEKRRCGDDRKCRKTPVQIDEVKIRAQLPLVSGLSRSKNVQDIVNRLYPKPKYRIVPAATPFTSYYMEDVE